MQPRDRSRITSKKPAVSPPASPRRPWMYWLLGAAALGILAAGVEVFFHVQRTQASGPAGLNVLLITVDTTRADFLGCYGRSNGRTPNMDGLAREGVLFQRCISASPMTGPSHASIFTAAYPFVHGARRNGTHPLVDANVTLTEILKKAGYRTQATIANFILNRQFGFSQGFDVYHDVSAAAAADPQSSERKGDEICNDALTLLRTPGPEPFFLWVHFFDPHAPYETKRPAPYTVAEAYEDEIAFMDEQIGRLLGELRSLGIADRTLVVLVGDHGEGLGEHGESQHGHFLYETTLRVPLLMRSPGKIPAGRSVPELVRTIDIAPTVLALLNLPPLENVQGVSLLPLVQSNGTSPELRAYSETLEPHAQFGLSRLRSLTTPEWKYILAPRCELYRRQTDPAEAHSLTQQEPAVAVALRQELKDVIAHSPPAVSAGAAPHQLTEAERARLESLGYAGTGVRGEDPNQSELDRFEPEGGNPADYAAQMELADEARDALGTGDFARAQQLLETALQVLPDAPHIHANLGLALSAQGRSPEALQHFERALALAPDDSNLRSTYGMLLVQLGRFQEAVDQLRIVLRPDRKKPMVLQAIAFALTQLGEFDEAEQHLQWALEIDPRSPRVLHMLGVVRIRQNRLAEAEPYLSRALEIDPNFRQCQEDLHRLRTLLEPPNP
jgi:choline-sulfatase